MSTDDAPRKRGRPASAELAAQRRRELVETAYAVFAEKGYTAAGVNDITDRLGVATGTFYRYFDSKRDILDHVIDLGVEKMVDAAGTVWTDGELPRTFEGFVELVRNVGLAVLELVDAEPGMVQMLLFEATAVDDELTTRLLRLHEMVGAFAAMALDQGVTAGYLREGIDTQVLGKAIYMLVSPTLVEMMNGPLGPETRARHLDVILDFVLNGVRASAAPGTPGGSGAG